MQRFRHYPSGHHRWVGKRSPQLIMANKALGRQLLRSHPTWFWTSCSKSLAKAYFGCLSLAPQRKCSSHGGFRLCAQFEMNAHPRHLHTISEDLEFWLRKHLQICGDFCFSWVMLPYQTNHISHLLLGPPAQKRLAEPAGQESVADNDCYFLD